MSKKFELGKTYRLSLMHTLLVTIQLKAKFAGEKGLFTVHEVNADGSAFTDDITSPILTDRCLFPPDALDEGVATLVEEERV